MTTNLAKSASNNGQIIKSWLPNDRRAKFLPSVVGNVFDWLRVGGHLGNVDLSFIVMPPVWLKLISSGAAWLARS